MKGKNFLQYVIILACTLLIACSQDPASTENQTIGDVSGVVSLGTNTLYSNDFEVRAYAYVPQQWYNNVPVNAVGVSSDGSYSMKLPTGNYIFTLYNKKQTGPSFYYQFQNQFPCKTYELQLQDHDTETLYTNEFFFCEPEPMAVPDSGSLPGINFDIQETGTIKGQISQAVGRPFTQVTIKVYAAKTRYDQSIIDTSGKYETSLSGQTRPDANGGYTLCCLPKGNYILMAEPDKPEYISLYTQYNEDQDRINYVYCLEQAEKKSIYSGDKWNVNFNIRLGATIIGQIQSEDTPIVPVKDVLVSALSISTNYSIGKPVASDANGNYTINGLPQQRYILHADTNHTTYQSCYFNSKYNTNDADAFDINNTNTLIKHFNLQKQGKLVARILDKQTDTEITNNKIYVKIYNSSDLRLVDTIQSNNGIIVANLDEGKYKAEVITNGTSYASIYHANETSLKKADDIPIYNGEVNDTVNFKLQPGGSIKGTVVGQDLDNPDKNIYIYDCTIVAYSKSNPAKTYQTKTDIDGNYLINGLPEANDYIVQAQTNNNTHIAEYYHNTYFKNSATTIEVDYGQISSNKNFDLKIGSQIYGKVTNDTNNEPISGITITTTNLDTHEKYSTTTDSNGMYVITGIPSGYEQSTPSAFEYTIFANTKGTSFDSTIDTNSNLFQFERNEDQREFNFRLKLLPKLCGTVICPSMHQFDYCFDNITPGNYDLILLDEENKEIDEYKNIYKNFELEPNQEKENMDFEL